VKVPPARYDSQGALCLGGTGLFKAQLEPRERAYAGSAGKCSQCHVAPCVVCTPDPARAGREGSYPSKHTWPRDTSTGLSPAPRQGGLRPRGAPRAPTQAPLSAHSTAAAGRRAPAFPAPALPAAGCLLLLPQRSEGLCLTGRCDGEVGPGSLPPPSPSPDPS